MSTKIAILLSTYNGQKYIQEQLDSLKNQTYRNFVLFIRDDCSKDHTVQEVEHYYADNGEIVIVPSMKNVGPKTSFSLLLDFALDHGDYQYFMFMDQDDFWLPDKIEQTLIKMKGLERDYPITPILVHTDLKVVDQNLQMLSESFWSYININPTTNSLNRIMIQNVVTGCTMMFNRQLGELSKSIPSDAIMHDWWIALVASTFGKIGLVNTSTILYRQHNSNSIGAKKLSINSALDKMIERNFLQPIVSQANAFYIKYEQRLQSEQREILLAIRALNSCSPFKRIYYIFKYRLFKNGVLRNIGFIVKSFINIK